MKRRLRPYERSLPQDLHTVKSNQIKMMRNRGFPISEEEQKVLTMTTEEFIREYRKKSEEKQTTPVLAMNELYFGVDEEGEATVQFVYYPDITRDKKQFGARDVKLIKATAGQLQNKVTRMILITSVPFQKGILDEILVPTIEIFFYKNLFYDLMESPYIQRYQTLSLAQNTSLLRENGKDLIKKSKLMEIKKNDPITLYLGLKGGSTVITVTTNYQAKVMTPQTLEFNYISKRIFKERPSTSQ